MNFWGMATPRTSTRMTPCNGAIFASNSLPYGLPRTEKIKKSDVLWLFLSINAGGVPQTDRAMLEVPWLLARQIAAVGLDFQRSENAQSAEVLRSIICARIAPTPDSRNIALAAGINKNQRWTHEKGINTMSVSTKCDPIRAVGLHDAHDILHNIFIGYKLPWWSVLPIIGPRAWRGYRKLYSVTEYIYVQILDGVNKCAD
jgi:hypothetical protein